ncbi:hypothetical protein BGP79_15670 [Tersicoccus sp. Bi-70]|nr:hypothetical protein BGP79_15670 [Tersicoccus sp. Bi-70]
MPLALILNAPYWPFPYLPFGTEKVTDMPVVTVFDELAETPNVAFTEARAVLIEVPSVPDTSVPTVPAVCDVNVTVVVRPV